MTRRQRIILAASGALALVAGALVVVPAAGASVDTQAQTARDTLANCQLLASKSTGEQRQRARDCVTDQTRILALLGAAPTPTPTKTPTATPTPTRPPASTPPVTTPPVTTPPTTTPPTQPASDWPTPDTTGVPAGWQPKANRTADLVVTTPGAVVEDIRLVGADIRIKAAGVTIRRVEVQGGVIWDDGPCHDTVIEDTSVIRAPGQVTRYDDGPVIGPGGYTLRRVKVDGVAEGVRVGEKDHCGPVVIEDSYLRVQAPDNCGGDWHGDTIQGYQGPALTVRHSTVEMAGMTSKCDGTSPFFYPDQGNTRADVDGMLVIGGVYYAFRLGTAATVKDLNVVGGVDVRCSRMETWQAATVTLDAYRVTSAWPLPCTTEGGN